jgi:hypothetical protein
MQNSEEILTSAQKARPSKTEVALTSFCLKIRFKQHLDSAPLHFLQRQSSVSSTKAQHRRHKDMACFGKSPFRPVSALLYQLRRLTDDLCDLFFDSYYDTI